MYHHEVKSALELCFDFNPNADFDFFTLTYGEMYEAMYGVIEREWELLHDNIEDIEKRLRQPTGKSADELDAIELDFWDECNRA
jgi:hypothetical protein